MSPTMLRLLLMLSVSLADWERAIETATAIGLITNATYLLVSPDDS